MKKCLRCKDIIPKKEDYCDICKENIILLNNIFKPKNNGVLYTREIKIKN
jgi:rRNA maturation endonuclease Nob1